MTPVSVTLSYYDALTFQWYFSSGVCQGGPDLKALYSWVVLESAAMHLAL